MSRSKRGLLNKGSTGWAAGVLLAVACSSGAEVESVESDQVGAELRRGGSSEGHGGPARERGRGHGRGHHEHGHGHGHGHHDHDHGGPSGGASSAGGGPGSPGSGGSASGAGGSSSSGGAASGAGGHDPGPDECGDGIVVWLACDDGNTIPGDGCDPSCNVEPGWTCPEPGLACRQPTCGDGYQDSVFIPGDPGSTGGASAEDPGGATGGDLGAGGAGTGGSGGWGYYLYEGCDDGNTSTGDGCDTSCNVEGGWVCPEPGAQCRQPTCGDGHQDAVFVPGDPNGAGGSTGEEPSGAGGTSGGDPGGRTGAGGSNGGGYFVYEGCDDGNSNAGDGCDPSCNVESGWLCPEPGVSCRQPTCGDGFQDSVFVPGDPGGTGGAGGEDPGGTGGGDPGAGGAGAGGSGGWGYYLYEACDDGNTSPTDGCDTSCNLEPGWLCEVPGSACRYPQCGDGIVDWYYPEGSTGAGGAAGAGGSPGGSGEPSAGGRSAGGAPGSEPVEQCDDGNTAPGDGCGADCRAE